MPEAVTLRRALMLMDARRANPPLSVGRRAMRCIGGPLHGGTMRLEPGQTEARAVVPSAAVAHSWVDTKYPDAPHKDIERGIYRIEKFGSGTHRLVVSMLVWQDVDVESADALRLMLDAFMPEMLMAYEVREDA